MQLNRNGEITSRINDLNNIKDLFTKEIINALISFVFLIMILIVMFSLNINLTIYLILLTIIYVLIIYYYNKKIFSNYFNYLNSVDSLMDNILEDINNLKCIKNFNREKYFLNKLKDKVNNNYHNLSKLEILINKLLFINNLNQDLSLILIIIFNYYLNNLDILIYILYFNYYNEIINYYTNLLSNLSYFKSILSRLNGIYYLNRKEDKNNLKINNNDIVISNLSYSINLNNIFNNYNLKINSNEKVLIKGINGVGKTTLLNILNGNIDDYQGNIYIDNKNIKGLNKKYLKEKVLFCSGNDNTFTDTIINNIVLDQKYNESKFLKITKILELDSISLVKNNGYDVLIKDNISNGERQRIILARALYQDAKILLLDEVLSFVHYKLRRKIVESINSSFKDKTIIYVCHNLEDKYFDKVVNLTARKE